LMIASACRSRSWSRSFSVFSSVIRCRHLWLGSGCRPRRRMGA
jgi:hypothetical protein